MTVVWAHLGLSKELKYLHPTIHAFIIDKLFTRHPNLYADISWDVLSKQLFMNFKDENVSLLHHDVHEDFSAEIDEFLVDTEGIEEMREELEETWEIHEKMMSSGTVSGPTHAMAIYLELFHNHSDRFLTGTDFVSSMGPAEDFPGLVSGKGCMKDKKNHARQVTDTGSINMFLNDEAFQNIVLGGNYFRITRLNETFAPPPVCGDTVRTLLRKKILTNNVSAAAHGGCDWSLYWWRSLAHHHPHSLDCLLLLQEERHRVLYQS